MFGSRKVHDEEAFGVFRLGPGFRVLVIRGVHREPLRARVQLPFRAAFRDVIQRLPLVQELLQHLAVRGPRPRAVGVGGAGLPAVVLGRGRVGSRCRRFSTLDCNFSQCFPSPWVQCLNKIPALYAFGPTATTSPTHRASSNRAPRRAGRPR
jgi:hypothetical protein